MFILLFHAHVINSNTIIEHADIIHNILTIQIHTIHYSYRSQILSISNFFFMKV